MLLMQMFDGGWTQWLLFPLLIFIAEVVHLMLGTMRVVFISRGLKPHAAITGFFEILIFLVALGQIVANLTNVLNYIAFAGGFAVGNVVGLWLEEKMAIGLLNVTVITQEDAHDLVDYLRSHKFGVTSVSATGLSGRVRLIVVLIKRKMLPKLRALVEETHPNAFITVQDVRSVNRDLMLPHVERTAGPFAYFKGLFERNGGNDEANMTDEDSK